MIADQDRSGYIGASDTDKVIGNWATKTWQQWWTDKLGISSHHFTNDYLAAGTHYEHRILESLEIPMEFDKQVIVGRLRVNLDGNTDDTNYECKTTNKPLSEFTLPKKYINQVQVQMYGSGLRHTEIVVYHLLEEDYKNFFRPIDSGRRRTDPVDYDEQWINGVYLPKFKVLEQCLIEGTFPKGVKWK